MNVFLRNFLWIHIIIKKRFYLRFIYNLITSNYPHPLDAAEFQFICLKKLSSDLEISAQGCSHTKVYLPCGLLANIAPLSVDMLGTYKKFKTFTYRCEKKMTFLCLNSHKIILNLCLSNLFVWNFLHVLFLYRLKFIGSSKLKIMIYIIL